jgi:hypothetical protein
MMSVAIETTLALQAAAPRPVFTFQPRLFNYFFVPFKRVRGRAGRAAFLRDPSRSATGESACHADQSNRELVRGAGHEGAKALMIDQ